MSIAVLPDRAICPECRTEILSPFNRRFRYPFTYCSQCGPGLSILYHAPCERANTSMAAFKACPECLAEYENPGNRHFHALSNACPNRAQEPPCIDDSEARQRMGDIANYVLWHDRTIVNRVEDSMVRLIAGKPRVMRHARGYAPTPPARQAGNGQNSSNCHCWKLRTITPILPPVWLKMAGLWRAGKCWA
jgi:hydrogenase maturation factor HypF (carbamoyltransferase family)